MYSHHFTPIHASQMGRTARLRSLKRLLYHFHLPRKSENTCYFFLHCALLSVYFLSFCTFVSGAKQTKLCVVVVRGRVGAATGAAGALIKGAKKGSRVKVPRRDEAPAVSRVCISQPVALPRWS